MKFISFYCLFAYSLFCACEVKNNKKPVATPPAINTITVAKAAPEHFDCGKIIPKINCQLDTNLSFALYLPTVYDSIKDLPVIYFFDPDGAGTLPLSLYKQLAEQYGYILISSNDSKNGLQPDKLNYITKNVLADTKNRININKDRIYTAGFSGGARVAVATALNNPDILGVAGCGAGFPNTNKQIDPKFLYVSFAGNRDFNLTELKDLDTQLSNLSLRHFLLEFEGKHEWPAQPVFENAIYAFEFNAMQKKIKPKNDLLITRFIKTNDHLIKKYSASNQYYETYNLYKKMIFFLGQLADVKPYYSELVKLQNSDGLKKVLQEKKKMEEQEQQLQESYSEALLQKDFSWWTGELKKMNGEPANEKGVMYKRIESYLGLIVYLQATGALKQNNIEAADKLLNIYKLLEPKNKEQAYLFAVLYAKRGETEHAIAALHEAKKLGFADVKRLAADEAFKDLQHNDAFKELIMQLTNHS